MMGKAKKWLGLTVFFILIVTALFSPLASNDVIPPYEMVFYVGYVVQAKLGLDDGQIPLRTSPIQWHGYDYPIYQFTSPLPYTIGGLIYKYFTPSNPYEATKYTMMLALIFGGIFMYKTADLLTKSSQASLIASVIYLMSPYIISFLTHVGAFTEACSWGMVPIAVYGSLKCYYNPIWRRVAYMGISWFLLATTHNITFFFTFVFSAIFISLLSLYDLYCKRNRQCIIDFLKISCGFALGIALSLFFLGPLAVYGGMTNAGYYHPNPMQHTHLTNIYSLLSPAYALPEPVDRELHPNPYKISISVGWPMLLLSGLVAYHLFFDPKVFSGDEKKNSIFLFLVFIISFFVVWSPFDFWKYLPNAFMVVQWSFRVFPQILWSGTLLSAIAIKKLVKKENKLVMLVGVLIVGVSAGLFFTPLEGDFFRISLQELVSRKGSMEHMHPQPDYLFGSVYWKAIYPGVYVNNELPVEDCKKRGTIKECSIEVTRQRIVQLPILYSPEMLSIEVNGEKLNYFPVVTEKPYMLAGINLPPGKYFVTAEFTGLWWANWISLIAWVLLAAYISLEHLKNAQL
ncbi:MAG: hypothetical protein KKD39_01100 [Candidatus Altiarchaeota archaeon]|nr:hypothetical protein [Candidatus Altiarchaeota archaeon]